MTKMTVEGTFDYAGEDGFSIELVDISGNDDWIMDEGNIGTAIYFPLSRIDGRDLAELRMADEGEAVEFRIDQTWLADEDLISFNG